MIAKKNSRYDLEQKRTALFTIGLLTSGSLTLAAFTWTSPIKTEIEKEAVRAETISFLVDYKEPQKEEPKVVHQEIPKVEEQQQTTTIDVRSDINEQVTETSNKNEKSDSQVSVDGVGIKFSDEGNDEIIPLTGEIFEYTDKEAEFVGGYIEMQKYISKHFRFNPQDLEFGETGGKVYVSFVVETDGSISNINVERGVSESIDREAKRVVRSFPKWIPGEVKMQKVRTRVRLPINILFE